MSSIDQPDTTESTRMVVLEFFTALRDANPAGMRRGLADHATWWLSGDLPTSGTWHGPDEILDHFLAAMFATLDSTKDVTQHLHHLVADGDRAVAEWTSKAITLQGEPYENDYLVSFQVSGGLIVAVREYFDTDYARRRMFPNAQPGTASARFRPPEDQRRHTQRGDAPKPDYEAGRHTETLTTERPTAARDILDDYLAALTAGDIERIADSFAETATWSLHGRLPLAGVKHGRDEIMTFLVGAGSLYKPGTQAFEFGKVTAEGNRAVLEWKVTGTASATGKAYDNNYCGIFETANGRITSVREYLDTLHASEVLFADPTA